MPLYEVERFEDDPDGDADRAGDGYYFQLTGEDSWSGAWHSEEEAEAEAESAIADKLARIDSLLALAQQVADIRTLPLGKGYAGADVGEAKRAAAAILSGVSWPVARVWDVVLRNEDGAACIYDVVAATSRDAVAEAWRLYRDLNYVDCEPAPAWTRPMVGRGLDRPENIGGGVMRDPTDADEIYAPSAVHLTTFVL